MKPTINSGGNPRTRLTTENVEPRGPFPFCHLRLKIGSKSSLKALISRGSNPPDSFCHLSDGLKRKRFRKRDLSMDGPFPAPVCHSLLNNWLEIGHVITRTWIQARAHRSIKTDVASIQQDMKPLGHASSATSARHCERRAPCLAFEEVLRRR